MEELRQALYNYKNYTCVLIECLEDGNYEALEILFNKRQELIDYINGLNYEKDEFIAISQELQMLESQKKLEDILSEKLKTARNDLNRYLASKNVNRNYNKRYNVESIFFNKKI